MSKDDGDKQKQEEAPQKPRMCPFLALNEECVKDKCALYMRVQSPHLAAGRPIGACALVAQVLILSTLKSSAPPPMGIPDLRV